MKPSPVDYFGEFDDPNSTMAMDVDDIEGLDIFGDGSIVIDNKLADADFFNAFQDDFDDSDIS